MKTLVVGDSHASPNYSNERFTALGNYIVEHRPDNIVQIGDFGSFDSISFHERGNPRAREGKRIADDFRAVQDAYRRLMQPVLKLQGSQRASKVRMYQPNGFWFESNHEFRIKRYVDENPVLEGFLPESDLVGASKDGWDIVGWKHCAFIDGVAFTHIPVHAGNNQPISGKYVAMRAAETSQCTVVFGHTHRFAMEPLSRMSSEGSSYVEGINVGWFGDYTPEYIDGHMGTSHWWSGLVMLHHDGPGKVDVERISMNRVKSEYL